MNLPPHIPHGAIEKTDYINSLNPYFEEFGCRFFVFDGKVYSFSEVSLYNEMDWFRFCEYIKGNDSLPVF